MREIIKLSVLELVRRPLYWLAMFVLPLFLTLVMTTMMQEGIPEKVPAAVVDRDGTSVSRQMTQNLASMQLVDITEECNSFSQARHHMQEGKIYGYFLIPENFEKDLLSGKSPTVSFYTNMTYFIPGSMLFKNFKTTAMMSEAGMVVNVAQAAGVDAQMVKPLLQPVNIVLRGIGNPGMNYAIYLGNSFVPCGFELMIMLLTCFSLGQEIKYGGSRRLMRLAGGNVYKAVFAKLLPQTAAWWVMILFMESWLYGWQGFPMEGSWWWLTVSELLYVLACQGFGLFIFCIFPNLRMSLSVSALTGILAFSIAAFSFPEQSMYPAMSIFSWMMPVRYNFLIYVDQALNGIDVWYSRWWYLAYIGYILLPFTLLWRLRKNFLHPVYAP